MNKLNDALLESMTSYLSRIGYIDVKAVSYEEDERSEGYCDTCYYEYTVVSISFTTANGSTGVYEYFGDFGQLIRELTK